MISKNKCPCWINANAALSMPPRMAAWCCLLLLTRVHRCVLGGVRLWNRSLSLALVLTIRWQDLGEYAKGSCPTWGCWVQDGDGDDGTFICKYKWLQQQEGPSQDATLLELHTRSTPLSCSYFFFLVFSQAACLLITKEMTSFWLWLQKFSISQCDWLHVRKLM